MKSKLYIEIYIENEDLYKNILLGFIYRNEDFVVKFLFFFFMMLLLLYIEMLIHFLCMMTVT